MSIEMMLPMGKFTFKLEGKDAKDLHQKASALREVFGESRCGCCHCDYILPSHRRVDDWDYYELVCQNPECGAHLPFGQKKDEAKTLFPKRKVEADGRPAKPGSKTARWSKTNGWTKFRGEADDQVAGGCHPEDEDNTYVDEGPTPPPQPPASRNPLPQKPQKSAR